MLQRKTMDEPIVLDGGRAADRRFPWWSLPNCFSIDAVAVGLVWQSVFTWQYCARFPTRFELVIVGLSIWLVYTADRLLDSLRLDLDRPHTLRHRLHHELRKTLSSIWLLALLLNITVIVKCASESQLRWGFAAIGIVSAYVVCAQIWRQSVRWFPKELIVGAIFSFGVGLTAWAESPTQQNISLFIASVFAALLFALNCLAIAHWERDLDRFQKIDSVASRAPTGIPNLIAGATMYLTAAIVLWSIGLLPGAVTACLALSSMMLLFLLASRKRTTNKTRIEQTSSVDYDLRVVLADLAIALPPLTLITFGIILE